MEKGDSLGRDPQTLQSEGDQIDSILAWRRFVEDLKGRWKHLWWSRIDDKVRAEGIASDEFPKLFVEKGTIIIATKDYKPPSFNEILREYMPATIADQLNPNPLAGGIGRFIRNFMRKQRPARREPPPRPKRPKNQQRKHGGRGWLHYILE